MENQIITGVVVGAITTVFAETLKLLFARFKRSTPEAASAPPFVEPVKKKGFGVHVVLIGIGIIVGTAAANQAPSQPFSLWPAAPVAVTPWPPSNAQWLAHDVRLECQGPHYVFVTPFGAQPVQWSYGADCVEFINPLTGLRWRINRDGTSLVLNVYNVWQIGPIGVWQRGMLPE